MTQNNQTPYESRQSLVDVNWGGEIHHNALLNTGLRSELPVRWSGDKMYEIAGKTTITYSFISKSSILGYGDDVKEIIQPTHDFSEKQKSDIRKIFENLESYVNINFVEVADASTVGTIRIGFNTITDEQGNFRPGIYATADPPSTESRGGDIWFNKNFSESNFSGDLVERDGLAANGETPTAHSVMVHEILHALGLEHPDNPKYPIPDSVRNWEHTVLSDSYSHDASYLLNGIEYGVSSTPMPWDIAGIQHLYGANQVTNSGDTVYSFNSSSPFYKTIWDSSGIDTIDLQNFNNNVSVHLIGGKLSTLRFNVADPRWSAKQHGNLGIAFGSTIENAFLGSGDDYVKGNVYSNVLIGNKGDDKLVGVRGADTLRGESGDDELRAGNGRDIITGGAGSDTMYGGFGLNTFEDADDGEIDQLFFKSDQHAYNWIYDKDGNSPNGEKADKIMELDPFDEIFVQGVETEELDFRNVWHRSNLGETLDGIGIYASGTLEAVYVGDDLSLGQIKAMTQGIL